MGTQLQKFSSFSKAHKQGFQQIDTKVNEESFQNKEIYGYHLNSDPDSRDYFIKCPNCQKILVDNGINENIECDNCKHLINFPDNNINEIKKEYLFIKSFNNKKRCVKCKNCMSFFLRHLPFREINTLNTPSFKTVNLLINKDKLNDNENLNEIESYNNIMHNIILPFFQFKSRLLNKGKIFLIGNYEFKVLSTTPNYMSGKVSSETLIRCNQFYSNIIPITKAFIITNTKYENDSDNYIKENIINTPYPSQLSILQNTLTRIHSYDLYIRNCIPSYGVINNETQITILNKDIEQLRSITIAIINNQNSQNNKIKDKKNSSFLIERYYKPYFLSGMHKYVERGDTITIGDLEIFVLKCSPKSGYVINSTKCILKYGKTKEQCIERINNEIERERERNNNVINNELSEINNTNTNNSTSNNYNVITRIHSSIRTRNQSLQERLRLLNEFFMERDLYYLDFNLDSNDFIRQQKIENIMRGLPVFNIDKKYMKVIEKSEEHYIKKCIICMENYKIDDTVKTLPCFHIFHKNCIEGWFNNNKNNCPICKNDILNNEFNNEENL